jgi:hypothetical protein
VVLVKPRGGNGSTPRGRTSNWQSSGVESQQIVGMLDRWLRGRMDIV